MENGQNAISGWDLSLVTSCNQSDEVRSHQDVMVRRMKNRERQRRYRARKRLEADRKKTHEPQPLPYLESDSMRTITSVPPPKEIEYVVSGRKKESTVDHFTPVQTEVPVYGTPVDFITRVRCQRDWKRDARRAHMFKEEEVRVSGPIIPLATPANGSQAQPFPSDTKVLGSGYQLSGPKLDNNQERKVMPSRRHWKEEARNKKT